MINMFLRSDTPGYTLIDNQVLIGTIFLLIVFVTVPVMLFVKPCCAKTSKKHNGDHELLPQEDQPNTGSVIDKTGAD
jgi:hypothetical protein